MATKKSGLGKSLNMLLSNSTAVRKDFSTSTSVTSGSKLQQLSVEKLKPGIYQPRREICPEALQDLSDSIKTQGLLQPIAVRQLNTNSYEIIAGERRYRAAKLAGLDSVPVIVHDVDDKTTLALAIIENIQREDLNPMEEARALHRLLNEFDLTHQQGADIVSKSRTAVSNLLRLMNLHEDVKVMLEQGKIEMGHARALLTLDDEKQCQLAKLVIAKNLTVRETESYIRKLQNPEKKTAPIKVSSPEIDIITTQLEHHLSTKVSVESGKKGQYKVVVYCEDLGELDRFVEKVT